MVAVPAYSSAVALESPIYGLWQNGTTSTNDDSKARIGSQYVKYVIIISLVLTAKLMSTQDYPTRSRHALQQQYSVSIPRPDAAYCADRQSRLRRKSMQGYASRVSAF